MVNSLPDLELAIENSVSARLIRLRPPPFRRLGDGGDGLFLDLARTCPW